MTPEEIKALVESVESAKWTDVGLLVVAVFSLIAAGVSVVAIFKQLRDASKAQQTAADALKISAEALRLSTTQYAEDHDRSRREFATQLCLDWSRFLEPETNAVCRLIEDLSESECNSLAKLEVFKVSEKHKTLLQIILGYKFPDIEITSVDGYVSLEGRSLLLIRHNAMKYLNMLESVLSSWLEAVADKEIIEKEFSYIFNRSKSMTALEHFRLKAGNEHFPAINEFIKHISRDGKYMREELGRRRGVQAP